MSVSLAYDFKATVTEVVTGNTDAYSSSNRTVISDQFNESGTLTSATTPPVTKSAKFVKALAVGAGTIDLTSLTGANGASVDGTGLKVQLFRMKNLGANPMTITFGAATPYALAGATFVVILAQNQVWQFYGNDATPDIAAGAKHMDLSGTASQTCEVSIVMG